MGVAASQHLSKLSTLCIIVSNCMGTPSISGRGAGAQDRVRARQWGEGAVHFQPIQPVKVGGWGGGVHMLLEYLTFISSGGGP